MSISPTWGQLASGPIAACEPPHYPGFVAPADAHLAIHAIFRIEFPRLVAGLARMVRDVGLAEEMAQDGDIIEVRRVQEFADFPPDVQKAAMGEGKLGP